MLLKSNVVQGTFLVFFKLLDLLKTKIMLITSTDGNVCSDIFVQMKDAQENFMTSHSKRVRGREDILEKVSLIM